MYAEEAVLGTLLKEPYLINDSELRAFHFINHENQNIFSAMQKLVATGHSVDMVTLLTQENPEDIGGAGKLLHIQNQANVLKIDSYVELVIEAWRKREKHRILIELRAK
jgi:replicative DNA helicase